MQKVYVVFARERSFDWDSTSVVNITLDEKVAQAVVNRRNEDHVNLRKHMRTSAYECDYYYDEYNLTTSLEDIYK